MEHSFASLFTVLAATIVASKLLGIIAQRIGQPAVLGELAAGILLGASVLGILDPSDPIIKSLSEVGVLILLFQIGLHTNFRSLTKVGASAFAVGVVGVIVPFVLGYLIATLFGLTQTASIICGAALTATSIGISARVLSDLGQLDSAEGRIVLGAAVFDDVIGLIILGVVSSLAAGAAISAQGFLSGGSVFLMGALAAGLVLHHTAQRKQIEKSTTTIGHFVVPIFFASVGAEVNLSALAAATELRLAASLLAVGVLGKFVAGYAPFWFHGRKSLIGLAMIPRGEVGLVFAQMGLATGALDIAVFSAVTLMVMGTTFIVPPLLKRYSQKTSADRAASNRSYSPVTFGGTD